MPRGTGHSYKYPASMLKADGTLSKAPGMARAQAAFRAKVTADAHKRPCKLAFRSQTFKCNSDLGVGITQRKKKSGGFCCKPKTKKKAVAK